MLVTKVENLISNHSLTVVARQGQAPMRAARVSKRLLNTGFYEGELRSPGQARRPILL
jgi:hypothetical protein